MTWADSLGNAHTLDRWRESIGLTFEQEQPAHHRGPLLGRDSFTRTARASMTYGGVRGVDKPVARLVMGCDNQPGMSHAAIMWDAYYAAGGNAFDTAYIYGGGLMEELLGYWHEARNLRDDLVIIGKGAHTPDNFPDRIGTQLTESLERLRTGYVDVYFLHRDNTEVPVGEFVDALNAELRAGRVRAFGGSNWTLERVRAANDYAAANGLVGFAAVSNQFSLARMREPIWPGVQAASEPEFREYLAASGLALMPWSSQARGFFTPWADGVLADGTQTRPAVTRVEPSAAELTRVWAGESNVERRRRAGELAARHGTRMINVALAYVLQQPFPTFPLIGPRLLAETRSSIESLGLVLSAEELAWLDLED
jgi:aryl-alcohol dehydrogenase-like predicted oxidoreductase